MDDITITNPPFVTPQFAQRMCQAETLRKLAEFWPATPAGLTAEDVRAALNAGAAMLDGTAPRRTPLDILAEDFGLKMQRFAGDKQVRVMGVRTCGADASRHIVETRVERQAGQACVQMDDEPLLTVYADKGVRPALLERVAMHGLLTVLKDHKRHTGAERRRRARAKMEVQA